MRTALFPLLLCISPLAAAQAQGGSVQDGSASEEVRAQNPPQARAPDDEGVPGTLPTRAAFERAHQYVDWMMGIAGNDAVLYSDLSIVVFMNDQLRERANDPAPEVQREIYFEALRLRLETLLKVQAGNDLGYDPELVEFLTDRNFELSIQGMGGHRLASETFQAQSVTPEQYRQQIEDRLLESSWSESVTGKAPAGIGRPIVDRYVRPGWVHSTYVNFEGSGSRQERALIGMHGERVVLQVLVLDEGDYPDTERLGAGLRKQYEDGERDFTSIVRTFGSGKSRERDGLLAPVEVQSLRQVGRARHATDALWELARSGKVGQVVGPLLREEDEARAWYLYRVEERLPATEPDAFLDRETQHRVVDYLQLKMDTLREERAFQAVLGDSYIWPEVFRSLLRDGKNTGN